MYCSNLQVFFARIEALFLDSSHVENIGVFDGRLQVVEALLTYALACDVLLHLGRHAEGGCRHVTQLDVRVESEKSSERVNSATVLQVAHHRHLKAKRGNV